MFRSLGQFGRRRWGRHTCPLTEEPAYRSVEEYRDHRLEEARRHLREVDPDLLQDEPDGDADGLSIWTTAGTQ